MGIEALVFCTLPDLALSLHLVVHLYLFLFKYLFIYLAVPGPSCSMQDLCCYLSGGMRAPTCGMHDLVS